MPGWKPTRKDRRDRRQSPRRRPKRLVEDSAALCPHIQMRAGRSVVAVDAQMIRTQRIDDDQQDRTRGVSLTTGRGQYQPKAQSERAQQRWHPPTVLPKIAERPETLELLLGQRALLAREGPVPGLGESGAEQSAEMRGGLGVACGEIPPLPRILVEIV